MKEFGLKNDLFCAIINWDVVLELAKNTKVKFTELPKSQSVTRDLSLLLDEAITYKEIVDLAKNSNNDILKSIDLFDVYTGKNLPEGKKSYAVRFILHDEKQTLEDKQIDAVMNKIQMVDLKSQYLNIKEEVDLAIQNVIDSAAFIKGPEVKEFAKELESYFKYEKHHHPAILSYYSDRLFQ